MSRYLRTVARETRAKIRPPSGLRLAPRAPAIFNEVHEERPADPGPTAREVPRSIDTPAAAPTVPAHRTLEDQPVSFAPPPPLHRELALDVPPVEKRLPAEPPTPAPAPLVRFETPEQPAIPIARHAANPRQQDPAPSRPAARSETAPAAPAPQQQKPSPEIIETMVRSASYLIEEERPAAKEKKDRTAAEFAIPEPVRNWLQPQTERPAPAVKPTQPAIPPAPPQPQTAPQPTIDVTIGRIEVTIESEPQPPLRIAPYPVSAPRKSTPPPRAGRLARQYLDR